MRMHRRFFMRSELHSQNSNPLIVQENRRRLRHGTGGQEADQHDGQDGFVHSDTFTVSLHL